jgi:hypothetical protein
MYLLYSQDARMNKEFQFYVYTLMCNDVPPVIIIMLIARPTAMSHKEKDNSRAFVLLSPMTIENLTERSMIFR